MHSFQNLIYQLQNIFVRTLTLGKIPLILLLSFASGYTTYHGMQLFITDWIAVIITVAVQTIIVMATVELAKIHWRANPLRLLSTLSYLLIALTVSIFFSYFKFYEISESTTIQSRQYQDVRQTIHQYLDRILSAKSTLIEAQALKVTSSRQDADQAYLGVHPDMPNSVQGIVGKGGYWKHFQAVAAREEQALVTLRQRFEALSEQINQLSALLAGLGLAELGEKGNYLAVKSQYEVIGHQASSLVSDFGHGTIAQPALTTYDRYVEIKPSLNILASLSPLALFLAVMVDLFTLILSYRLEAMPPETLSAHERRLAFLGLREFPHWKINRGGHLETGLDNPSDTVDRQEQDSWRKLIVGMLLNRGMLRKVSGQKVEFSPQLYPLIIEQLVQDMEAATQDSAVSSEGDSE